MGRPAANDRARIALLTFVCEWSLRLTVLVFVCSAFAEAAGLPIGRPLYLVALAGAAWMLFLMALTKLLHHWKWTSVWVLAKEKKESLTQDYDVAPDPLPPISDPPQPASGSAPITAESAVSMAEPNVIVVPADIVVRSRPSRHSVPLVAERHKRERPHPYRNLATALLLALVPILGAIYGIYYFDQARVRAGYRLDCSVTGTGRYAHSDCAWKK